MDVTDEIVAALTATLQRHGSTLNDAEVGVLTTPRNRWNAGQIGLFRQRVWPNWLTLRRLLREAAGATDSRAWMDALEAASEAAAEDPGAGPVMLVLLAREAIYNTPRWPDGTPRKEHPALGYAGMVAFFVSIALLFYSTILRDVRLVPLALLLLVVEFALLNVWRRRLEDADRAEYDRPALLSTSEQANS